MEQVPLLHQCSAWRSSHQGALGQCWAEQQSWGVLMLTAFLLSFCSHQIAYRDLSLLAAEAAFLTHP